MAGRRRDEAAEQRAAELARRINLLVDLVASETGHPFTYRDVRDQLEARGIRLTKPRWYYLKDGTRSVTDIPLLTALADIFDVPSSWLIQLEPGMPSRVSEHLPAVISTKRNEAREFLTRSLGSIDPRTVDAILKLLDDEEGLDEAH